MTIKYLCWDIDGTLLLTGRAGYDSLKEAVRDYLHVDDFDFGYTLAGRTDSAIVKDIVTKIKGRCTAGVAAGLMLTYVMKQKKLLKTHDGYLMPKVKETLEYLEENAPQYTNCLLTGNATEGARDKLIHYGIAKHFDFHYGAYGDLCEDRGELAGLLLQRIYIADPSVKPEEMLVIGDTPRDADCAAAIGAPTLIILSGSEYKKEDFADKKACTVIEKLPDNPEDFIALIKEIGKKSEA